MTEYREHRPDVRLEPFVRCLWELRTPLRERGEPAALVRVLPDGCMEWIFHLGPPFRIQEGDGRLVEQSSALLVGVTTRAVLLEPSSGGDVVGVRFHPGGARAFLRSSVGRWADRVAPLEELEDAGLAELEQRLHEVPRAQRIEVLTRELLDRRARLDRERPPFSGAVAALYSRRVSVDAVAHACGLTRRQLERRFRDEVGVGPKRLARLGRLQQAARWLAEGRARSSAIALAAGYCDQAHFTREFRELGGTTPGEYRREQAGFGSALLGPAQG